MAAGDDNYKMPMRRWLPYVIDKNEIPGLEWMDETKTLFKIPWTSKGHPGWENCGKLVKEWANHQGREEKPGVSLDFTTLKSNFRNAIHKCEDFDTDDEKSQLNLQTGNYKVYKLLTREEVMAKKKKKKLQASGRKRRKIQNSSIDNPNIDDGTVKTMSKNVDVTGFSSHTTDGLLLPVMADSASYFSPQNTMMTPQNTMMPPQNTMMPFQNAMMPPPSGQYYQQPLCQLNIGMETEIASQQYDANVFQQQTNQPGTSSSCYDWAPLSNADFLQSPQAQCTGDVQVSNISSGLSELEDLRFEAFLGKFGLSEDDLPRCTIEVYYNGERVLKDTPKDMEKGCRIFYGNEKDQKQVARLHQKTEEELLDYDCPVIRLPNLPGNLHQRFQEILDKTELGFIVKYYRLTHTFHVKRLCQSQVFYLNPHCTAQQQEPIKLNRQEEVCVFSYEKYLQQKEMDASLPDPVITLSVGAKSNLFGVNPKPKGVKIIVRPFVIKHPSFEVQQSSVPSLYFSTPTPEEETLRKLREVKIDNNTG